MSSSEMFSSEKCALWGRGFDDFVETAQTGEYRFIRRSWFELLQPSFEVLRPLVMPLNDTALLIRDEYEELYNFFSQESTPTPQNLYSGCAVIGHPGIGQSLLHRLACGLSHSNI
jgi:hypothetical protein